MLNFIHAAGECQYIKESWGCLRANACNLSVNLPLINSWVAMSREGVAKEECWGLTTQVGNVARLIPDGEGTAVTSRDLDCGNLAPGKYCPVVFICSCRH